MDTDGSDDPRLPDAASVDARRRDGAVVLRGVLDACEVALLRCSIEANRASLSPPGLVASPTDDPGRFVEDFCLGSRFPGTFLAKEARRFPPGSLAEVPDPSAPGFAGRTIGWALEPGDCAAFHMLALHASAGTGPGQCRRVFSAGYPGDDATHGPRRWRTSPPFERLGARLPAGAPMDEPLFPKVWPKA